MQKIYQVGGFVRDRLMGIPSKDLDYVCEFPSYDEMVKWIKTQGRVYLEQPQFWTVRAHLPNKPPADFVLARRDGKYTDGRRPDTVEVGTLFDDLARRDFTVNAIAYNEETGEYIDPHGGQKDIKTKLLRCVGNTVDRFHEDALRILRAIRFAITKEFMLSNEIMDAFKDEKLADKLKNNVSDDRKRDELLKCFSHDTNETINYFINFPAIQKACFHNSKLWLMPTLRSN